MHTILALTCVAGCALGMLIIALLLTQKNRSRSNLMLGGLIAVLSLDVLFSAAEHLSAQPVTNALLQLTRFPCLLFAPLLYLYLEGRVSSRTFRLADGWHFAPFAVVQLVAALELARTAEVPWQSVTASLNLVCTVLIGTYLILAVPLMRRVANSGQPCSIFYNCSVPGAAMLGALLSYWFKTIAGVLAPWNVERSNIADVALSSALAALACSALYRTASERLDANQTTPDAKQEAEKTKYGNNRLPDFVRVSILRELDRYMSSAEPWLRIDLTLSELATCINVNPHHLSQIINSEFGKSFACYINEYRVKAACRLLSEDEHRPILDIALESGFSSKSSFNALFKKHTDMTPSEYRKRFQRKDCLVA